jgi:DNA-3-methyladenine glycosylase II
MTSTRKIAHIKRHFWRADKKLLALFAKMELAPLRAEFDPSVFFAKLCREIISQQLAGSAARAIHGRFLTLFPKSEPTPKRVLTLSEKDLRSIGLSWAKVRYIRDLAEKTASRQLDLAKLGSLDNETAIAELSKVKGIGRWTAEMFLIFALGREDVFSHGDLGLRRGLEKLYGAHRTKTVKHIERITDRWSPYRSYGSLALWHMSDTAKKPKK